MARPIAHADAVLRRMRCAAIRFATQTTTTTGTGTDTTSGAGCGSETE